MKNVILILASFFLCAASFSQTKYFGKDDTLKIYRTAVDITIDGNGLEKCWDSVSWVPLQYVWMNPAELTQTEIRIDSIIPDVNDFRGKFKIVWSSKTNRIYMLAEITDDTLVNTYDWNNAGIKNNYPSYDDLEIFYQETGPCRQVWPGCDHTFNQNAKAIHLTSSGWAVDMGGPSWGVLLLYNKSLTMKLNTSAAPKYVWEISLGLVKSSVSQSDLDSAVYTKPLPANIYTTLAEKLMIGLTLNYCDADKISNPSRQSFISDVYLPPNSVAGRSNAQKDRNACWVDASLFGKALLKGYVSQDTTPIIPPHNLIPAKTDELLIYPNPAKENIWVVLDNDGSGDVTIKVSNMLGSVVAEKIIQKTSGKMMEEITLAGLPAGLYLVDVSSAGKHEVVKIQKN
jgi:hypothetical protein